MAGRGPTPKDRKRRQGHRDKEPTKLTVVPDAGAGIPRSRVPAAPRTWRPEIRRAWKVFWTSPLAQLVAETDHDTVRRLFGLKNDRALCQDVVAHAGHITKGSQGQPVLNPVLRQIQAYDQAIRDLEDRFGLSPRARLTLGISLQEDSNPLDQLTNAFKEAMASSGDDDGPTAEEDPRLTALLEPDQNS